MEEINDLISKILMVLLSALVLSNILSIKDLKEKINKLEEENNKVHEYILNRIGG